MPRIISTVRDREGQSLSKRSVMTQTYKKVDDLRESMREARVGDNVDNVAACFVEFAHMHSAKL